LFESLHGAPKGADAPSGAIGYRQAAFNISATATWRDPALDDQHVAWSRETAAAIEAWSWSGGGYANYMQADEPIERVRAMFADGAFDRLQALKRRYDPDNVLRRNQNSRRLAYLAEHALASGAGLSLARREALRARRRRPPCPGGNNARDTGSIEHRRSARSARAVPP
jgi:hypothetical protein